jgi:hypothetical protein
VHSSLPDPTPQLVTFLARQLDQRRDFAERMLRTVWPAEVYVTPTTAPDQPGPGEPTGCVSLSEPDGRGYARVWNPQQIDAVGRGVIYHGEVVHESAEQVWSARIAREILADVAAQRQVITDYEAADRAARTTKDALSHAEELGRARALRRVLELLARRYADRRDYPLPPETTGKTT